MVIQHQRHTFTDISTIGTLTIEHQSWFSIEDKDRGLIQTMTLQEVQAIKVYGKTCIPYGLYKVVITRSNRFSRLKKRDVFTPEIIGVVGFDGIRIHPANYASQLEGCIAPGKTQAVDMVGNSKKAYAELLEVINQAIKRGEEVWINITSGKEQVAL